MSTPPSDALADLESRIVLAMHGTPYSLAVWLDLVRSTRQREAIGTPSAEDLKRADELLRRAYHSQLDENAQEAFAIASRLRSASRLEAEAIDTANERSTAGSGVDPKAGSDAPARSPHSELIADMERWLANHAYSDGSGLMRMALKALLSAQQQPPAHFSDNVDDAILSVVAWARDQTNRWEYDHAVKYLHSLAAQQQQKGD